MTRIGKTHTRLDVSHRLIGGNRGMAVATAACAAVAVLGSVAVRSYEGVSGAVTSMGDFTDTAYQVGSGPVQLREGVGSTACFSTGSGLASLAAAGDPCGAIDDLGGRMDQVPGGPASLSSITLTNVGGVSTSGASLAAGTCKTADASDDRDYAGSDTSHYCAKVDVTIGNTTPGALDKCVFPVATVAACRAPSLTGTLASLASRTLRNPALSTLAVNASSTYSITVELDGSATNADQGLTASLSLTWSISQ
jgi:hypothetical protein